MSALEKNYCACGCGKEIPKLNNRGKRRQYATGHNPRRDTQMGRNLVTDEKLEAARKKKLNNWRNVPDGNVDTLPEFLKPATNKCEKSEGKHPRWVGDGECPTCNKVEKTPKIHFEYEEAEFNTPWDDAGQERKREHEAQMAGAV